MFSTRILLPPTLKVCEGLDRPSFKCWTATWNGKTYDAVLPNGVASELDVIAFETAAVIITRTDKTGPRAGKMQLYDGRLENHSIFGGRMYPQPRNPDASYLLWDATW
jgi:hypothetical protein